LFKLYVSLESVNLKEQIFLMGGNPPITKYSIVDKIVLSSKIERIVIFTVFLDNWQLYMKKYTEVFQSQFPNLNTDYLLLDTEQIDFDSYLDADLIIIGGGNTEKYLATYVNQEFKIISIICLIKGQKL